MKLLTARRFSMAMCGAFVACLAFAAHGSTNVFDDAVFWFRGGKDVNGDGYMQQGEFFDDLHANEDGNANHQMTMSSSYYTGQLDEFKKNAVFRNELVVFPALGTSIVKEMQVLHISDDIGVDEETGKQYYFPFDIKPRSVFARYDISNEYTVVSRIRLDDDTYNRNLCLMKLGYDGTKRQGMWIGFGPQNSNKCRRMAGYRTPNSGGVDGVFNLNLYVPTNTWVDVAVVVGNGKLRVGIAVPQSLERHGNNSTVAFAETSMWTDNCTILDDENYRFFCQTGQTGHKEASGTDRTAFIGSVQQLAIWRRALSDQDVMAAFGMPRPAIFRAGFDNGNSNEFGGTRSGSSQEFDGLGSWQNIVNTMQAGDTWTVNFTALSDEANLAQIFSIKTLRGSAASQIEPKLNGTSLGECRVTGNVRAFWPVAENLVRAGDNTLVIERKDNGSGIFKLDAMELGGSFGVGRADDTANDGMVTNLVQIAKTVSSAADPNPTHWPEGLRTYLKSTNFNFRVWVDPGVVDACTSRFWTRVRCFQYGTTRPTGKEYFNIFVNGNDSTSFNADGTWKNVEINFNPSVLRGGWNDFEIRAAEAYPTLLWRFDHYRFETVLPSAFGFPPPPGISLILK